MNKKALEETTARAKWALAYCDEYSKTRDFSPLDVLAGKEDRETKLFCLCVDFLHTLEEATDAFTEASKKCI